MIKKYCMYVLAFSLLFFLCFTVYADPSVLINEVFIDASPQSIELINISSTSADISGWYLDDAGGTTYFSIPSNTVIYPSSCVVFSSDFNLNKASSDAARLFSNTYPPIDSSSALVDSYAYKKSPGTGISYSRIPDGSTDWSTASASLGLFNGSQTSCTFTPSPVPSPSPQPSISTLSPSPSPIFPTPLTPVNSVYISEFIAYPETGNNEWIEIYNDNDSDVWLVDWYIDDVENGGSVPKKISTAIPGKGYAVIDFTSSILNNDADQVRLLNSEKIIVDELEYQKAIQGRSYGRISWDNDSLCNQESSKGLLNNVCIVQPSTISKVTNNSSMSSENIKNKANPISEMVKPPSLPASVIIPQQDVLGISAHNDSPRSMLPYLLLVSGSYSILTISSVLVKMRHVQETYIA